MRSVALGLSLALSSSSAFAQWPIVPTFQVNTYTTSDQIQPRVDSTANGDFIVVWTSTNQDGDSFGAFGQRIGADGRFLGSEFRLNEATVGQQVWPAIAAGKHGRALATWVAGPLVPGRLFDASGTPMMGDFQIATYTTGLRQAPDVDVRHDGSFVVAWSSQGSDGDGRGALVRLVDADGRPVGPEIIANAYTTGDQSGATVAANKADGSFLVVWGSAAPGDGSGAAIYGRRFDPAGAPVGADFLVNTATTGEQIWPAVSVSRSGYAAVTWRTLGGGISGRAFDPAGAPIGLEFAVNTSPPSNVPRSGVDALAHDDAGNFVVVWSELYPQGIWLRRYFRDGTPRGGGFPAGWPMAPGNSMPVVESDDVGNWLVLTDGVTDGSSASIRAMRFGGLRSHSLEVDTAGNRVLEPGETVDMKPSWTNTRMEPLPVNGADLIEFTGPAGFAYTVVDGAANYFMFGPGQTLPCQADCYSVQVSDPPVRPQTHVDATAVELIEDPLGMTKPWRLHIGRSFTDVHPVSPFYRFVETLLHNRVTGGCTTSSYCPTSSTTREQMAVFVLVAKEGAGYSPPACGATPMFGDVPASNPFCRWVEELARRGVVAGCGGGNYCPLASVTRAQMPIFALRTLDPALNPPVCVTPMFADVPASDPFCRWIEELARRGVVAGCGGGNYCPSDSVTREQMGVFIGVTFGLTLYGP